MMIGIEAIAGFLVEISPLFLAFYLTAVGHGIVEKSGVLNLAIDGIFVLSIAIAFAEAVYTRNNLVLSILVAMLAAIVFGIILAFLVTKLPISHGAAGLSLMFLGYGLASMIGVPARTQQGRSGVSIGYTISGGDAALLYMIIVGVALIVWFVIDKTKIGAAIRAAGEDPAAAESLGVNVLYVRLVAAIVGFALIGIGAAVYELYYSPVWSEGKGMGWGWLAFAISLSAGRHPFLIIASAGLFAGLIDYMPAIQAAYNLPPDVAKMLPFVVALLAMVVFMATPLKRKLAPPRSLGKIYFREERTV